MTITPGLIYLMSLSESLSVFLGISAFMIFILAFFSFLFADELFNDDAKGRIFILKWGSILIFPLMLISVALPDKKTCYEMIIVPAAANSKPVQNIPQCIDDYLKQIAQVKSDK